jgi:hypothetical protein
MAVVDADDEHREAHDVRGQDELLALVVAHVARPREEVDGGEPLVLGQLDLARERVEMARERLHHLAQARVGSGVEARLDGAGQVGVGEVAPLAGCWLVGHARDPCAGRRRCQAPLHMRSL